MATFSEKNARQETTAAGHSRAALLDGHDSARYQGRVGATTSPRRSRAEQLVQTWPVLPRHITAGHEATKYMALRVCAA